MTGLHDSGNRQVFASGAMRDRAPGKGRYDALQVRALRRVALILEGADEKYGDCRNWEKGMPMSRFIDSAFRHLCQYMTGLRDEDHLGQAAWNLLSALETEELIKEERLPRDLADLPYQDVVSLSPVIKIEHKLSEGWLPWEFESVEGGKSFVAAIYPYKYNNFDSSRDLTTFNELAIRLTNEIGEVVKYCNPNNDSIHPPAFHADSLRHR